MPQAPDQHIQLFEERFNDSRLAKLLTPVLAVSMGFFVTILTHGLI